VDRCTLFATVGSEQRRQLLRDMGIEHVYDSRSLESADSIRRDTRGTATTSCSTRSPAPPSARASNC
jgi:hypothetical protein